MGTELGSAFAAALAAKDAEALRGLLAPDIDFKALTPGRFWEGRTPEEVLTVVFGSWFEPSDEITALLSTRTGTVGARQSVTYRLHVTNADGPHEVEQQAYFSAGDGQIAFLRILCSGYMPVG